jgi:hypothetical protein
MLFKRDVWALDRRAPVMIQRLRGVLDERRAQNAERALGNQPNGLVLVTDVIM